jgi:hypothetical protein
MKSALLTTLLCLLSLSVFGQNQTLMVDTNWTIVQTNTNPLVFRSPIGFGTNSLFQAQSRTNLGLTAVGNSVVTATNATSAQNAIGISATNMLVVSNIDIEAFGSGGTGGFVGRQADGSLVLRGTNITTSVPVVFGYTGFDVGILSDANIRTAAGLTLGALTNTNVTNFRTAIGVGLTDDVSFARLQLTDTTTNANLWIADGGEIEGDGDLNISAGALIFGSPLEFNNSTNAAATRTNLSLGLPALTNTSNVTIMRALSGSTDTNHPFSGSVSVVGTNNTNTLVFSNGILQSVQ